MKVLVTGADGFLGRAMTRALQAADHQAIAAVRLSAPSCIAVGNIAGNTDWRAALTGCDAVIHLAARVHQMRDEAVDPLSEFRRVNTAGTLNLAHQARAAGIKRFIFISTAKVHGEERDRPYVESEEPAPQDPYAISKWEAERGLRAIAEEGGMEVVIIRPPLVYGPGVKGNFKSMVKWVIKGLPLPLGAVHNKRSLVALDNLVDFIALCADREKSPRAANEVFLISDDLDVSTPELLCKIAGAYGARARLFPIPESWLRITAKLLGKSAEANRLLGSLTVNVSKARELLGWFPVVTMDQQLRKMADDVAAF